ncbi:MULTISPECIES: hypothetical protein, partial [Sinorhizobium]|uniref:hypothetical protein n=1 Tax=Sinorhizobium TaxID=28105 RepID=UPI001AEC7641
MARLEVAAATRVLNVVIDISIALKDPPASLTRFGAGPRKERREGPPLLRVDFGLDLVLPGGELVFLQHVLDHLGADVAE